ncbi:MAG TPA: transposase, partial [Anaerolineales bacterium]
MICIRLSLNTLGIREWLLRVLRNLAKRLKKTIVVMDNASVHTSEAFEECLPRWKKKGLIMKYLSTYAPELNL